MSQKTSDHACSECGAPYAIDLGITHPTCDCWERREEKERAEKEEQERIENWRSSQSDLDEKFNRAFIRGRYEGVAFDGLKSDDQNGDVMGLCVDWLKDIPGKIETGNGIALLGPTGTGKTVTLISLHREILKLEKYTSAMVNFTWFLARFAGSPEFWPMVDLLCKADVLFLDDLIQEERFRDFQVRVLYCIADYRWPLTRPTFFASNLYDNTREDIRKLHTEYIGNAAVVSRLFSKITIGILEGRDRR